MVNGDPLVLPVEAAAQAKAFVRAVHGEDDAVIEALTRAAAEACESYTRRVLLARNFTEVLRAGAEWTALSRSPVTAIDSVERMSAGGDTAAVPPEQYGVDIDADGQGAVRLTSGARDRLRIGYRAGLVESWAALPEALRHGVIRLAGHFYTLRTESAGAGPGLEPPASVAALWRPFRRLRIA